MRWIRMIIARPVEVIALITSRTLIKRVYVCFVSRFSYVQIYTLNVFARVVQYDLVVQTWYTNGYVSL